LQISGSSSLTIQLPRTTAGSRKLEPVIEYKEEKKEQAHIEKEEPGESVFDRYERASIASR
jgi:hypothetical protein